MNNASKEELDDFARQEIERVIYQLKAQEDIFLKQENLTKKVKSHDEELEAQAKKDEEHDRLLQAGEEHDKRQDLELEAQAKKDEEHDRLLQAREEHDKKQDLALEAQAKKNEEYDDAIKKLIEKDVTISAKLKEQTELLSLIKERVEIIENNRIGKKEIVIAYAIAGISFILAMIQFVI